MAEKKTVNVYTDSQATDSAASHPSSGEPTSVTPAGAADAAVVGDEPREADKTAQSPQPTASGRPGWLVPLLIIALLILFFVLFF